MGVILPSPEDVWHHLRTFLVATTRERSAAGTQLVEAKGAAEHPTGTRQPQISVVSRLRNVGLKAY